MAAIERELAYGQRGEPTPGRRELPRGTPGTELERPGRTVARPVDRAGLQSELGRLRAERSRHEGYIEQGEPAVRKFDEPTADYIRRVQREAEAEGLDRPAFAPSQELVTRRFLDYTAGGTKLPTPEKRRKYKLQRAGIQRTDPEVIFAGVQRNIRARIATETVTEQFDRHAHSRLRDMDALELKRAAKREGLDEAQFVVWFPGRFEDAMRERARHADAARDEGAQLRSDSMELDTEAFGLEVRGLLGTGHDDGAVVPLSAIGEQHRGQRGTIIPKAVHNEIFDSAKHGATLGGRLADRIKSAQARAVLGAGNLAWVVADTTGNAIAALVAGVRPGEFARAQAFWQTLDPKVRARLEQEIDIGQQRSQTYVPHLGVTANGRTINTLRAWRSTPIGAETQPLRRALHAGLRAQPIRRGIDAFLTVERKIANDPFRRAAVYHFARQEHFRRLDAELGQLNGIMRRVSQKATGGVSGPRAGRPAQ